MNQKEKNDISINIAILMDSILSETTSAEDVANVSIDFCKEMLNSYSDIREMVGEFMENKDWDTMISWYDFEKTQLK